MNRLSALLLLLLPFFLFSLPPPSSLRGTTLPPLETRTNIQTFANLMRHASNFVPYNSSDKGKTWMKMPLNETPPVDGNGYPLYMLNGTYYQSMACEIGTSEETYSGRLLENGTYIFTWEGDGEFSIEEDGQVTETKDKEFTVTVKSKTKVVIRIIRTNPTNPVQNLAFFRSKDRDTVTKGNSFTSEFLEAIKRFDLIRVCYWQNEYNNNNYTGNLSNIRPSTYFTQSWNANSKSSGVSDYFIRRLLLDLNGLKGKKTHLWFCVPSLASDELLQNIFESLSLLEDSTKIFLSSGDAWKQSVESDQPSKLKRIRDFATSYFKKNQSDIIYVATINSTSQWETLEASFNYDFSGIDAIGVPGVFGRDLGWDDDWLSLEILSKNSTILIQEATQSRLSAQTQLNRLISKAKTFNIPIVAFEGGPYFHAPLNGWRTREDSSSPMNAELEGKFAKNLIELNRNEVMKEVILDFMRRWVAIGGSTFVTAIFSNLPDVNGNGYLALSENLQQSLVDAPKLAGFLAEIAGNVSTMPYTSKDVKQPVEPNCKCKDSRQGTCLVDDTCLCFKGFKGDDCGVEDRSLRPNNCTSSVFGVNLDEINEKGEDWAFNDVFKQSSPWVGREIGTNRRRELLNVSLTDDGYPTKIEPGFTYSSLMMQNSDGHNLGGDYVLFYDGDGILTFSNEVIKTVWEVGKITLTLERKVTINSGFTLNIEFTNPNDPVRNIRIIRPGFSDKYKRFPFHPLWLTHLERFSVLRLSNWQNAKNQIDAVWESRTAENNARTFTENGVPIEYVLALANRLAINPWISIPYQADDNYITKLSELFKNQLRSDLQLLIEYGDEGWSLQNKVGKYAEQKGFEQKLDTNSYYARIKFYAKRSREVFQIFAKTFFGDKIDIKSDDRKSRLTFLISSKTDDTTLTADIIASQDIRDALDAVALTADLIVPLNSTYDYTSAKVVANLFEKDLLTSIDNSIALIKNHVRTIQDNKKKAFVYNLTISGNGHPFLRNVTSDSRFTSIFLQYLTSLKSNGIDVIVHSSYVNENSPSALLQYQNTNTSTSPIFNSVKSFINQLSNCKDPLYDCSSNDFCSKNGVCVDNSKCECFFGAANVNCSSISKLSIKNCLFDCGANLNFNNTCKLTSSDIYTEVYSCSCYAGFFGPYCLFPSCSKNCSYNGLCVNKDVCQCFPGFFGDDCSKSCNCGGKGNCDANGKCVCDENYYLDGDECKPQCDCPNDYQKCLEPGVCDCAYKCKHGTCQKGNCVCEAGWTGPDCTISTQTNKVDRAGKIGLQLSPLSLHSNQVPFLDLIQSSLEFKNVYANTFREERRPNDYPSELKLREDGYPEKLGFGQAAESKIIEKVGLTVGKGDYVITYEGEGFIEIIFDIGMIKSQIKGRIEFSIFANVLEQDTGLTLIIYGSNQDKPIKNLRFTRKEDEHRENAWNPIFLSTISNFPALKFTHWQKTINSTTEKWEQVSDDQKLFTNGGQNGMKISRIVELINLVGADSWINVPHNADDDFVKELAHYLKDNVREDVKIYLEYSYEAWNALYAQKAYFTKKAEDKKLDNYLQYYANRALEVFEMFDDVYGHEHYNRILYVLTSETGNLDMAEKLLNYTSKNIMIIDALGLSSRFTCNDLGSYENAFSALYTPLEVIFKNCEDSFFKDIGLLKKTRDYFKNKTGKPTIVYETGPKIVEESLIKEGKSDEDVRARFETINRDDRMKGLYLKYLNLLKEGEFLTDFPAFHHNGIEYGTEGVLEYQLQNPATAPKYQALYGIMSQMSGKSYSRQGCTDKTALNYDQYAQSSNNLCEYAPLFVSKRSKLVSFGDLQLTFQNTSIEGGKLIRLNAQQVPFWQNTFAPIYRILPGRFNFLDYVKVCIKTEPNSLLTKNLGIWVSEDEGKWNLLVNSTLETLISSTCGYTKKLGLFGVWNLDQPPKNITMSFGNLMSIWLAMMVVLALIFVN